MTDTNVAEPEIEPHRITPAPSRGRRLPGWRGEALRTTFWLVPCIMIVVALALFGVTLAIDLAAYHHQLTLPFWLRTGSADAGRQVLIAIAAAIITVIGVVFSITILALTLASQQFGPRMLRKFMRDFGNQITLGVFVGSFVYSVVTLGSITTTPGTQFIPHLSISVSEALLLVDLGVLVYFIHHIAKSIQLPEVIAGIAEDLFVATDTDSLPPSYRSKRAHQTTQVGAFRTSSSSSISVVGRCPRPPTATSSSSRSASWSGSLPVSTRWSASPTGRVTSCWQAGRSPPSGRAAPRSRSARHSLGHISPVLIGR